MTGKKKTARWRPNRIQGRAAVAAKAPHQREAPRAGRPGSCLSSFALAALSPCPLQKPRFPALSPSPLGVPGLSNPPRRPIRPGVSRKAGLDAAPGLTQAIGQVRRERFESEKGEKKGGVEKKNKKGRRARAGSQERGKETSPENRACLNCSWPIQFPRTKRLGPMQQASAFDPREIRRSEPSQRQRCKRRDLRPSCRHRSWEPSPCRP